MDGKPRHVPSNPQNPLPGHDPAKHPSAPGSNPENEPVPDNPPPRDPEV